MEGFRYEIEKASVVVSGANSLIFQPVEPVDIIRVGAIVTVDVTAAVGVITLNHELIAGGALVPSGAAKGGTMTIPISAVPTGVYKTLDNPIVMIPGEQLELLSNAGPTAGTVLMWVQYMKKAFQSTTTDRRDLAAITTPADSVDLVNYTKVTV